METQGSREGTASMLGGARACVGGIEAGMEGGVPVSGQSQFNKRVRDVTLVVVPGTRGRPSSTSGSRCLSGTRAPCDPCSYLHCAPRVLTSGRPAHPLRTCSHACHLRAVRSVAAAAPRKCSGIPAPAGNEPKESMPPPGPHCSWFRLLYYRFR